MVMIQKHKWGFVRETKEKAAKAGIDKDTGLHRTGLEEYLAVIFPGSEWIHDERFVDKKGVKYRIRPDYRCEKLLLVVEFDGLQHYQKPNVILKDKEKEENYRNGGYEVKRIPYFIQLTNEIVEKLFGVKVEEPLFDETIPSMGVKGENTPAFCCPMGITRMAEELRLYPQQMKVNLEALRKEDNEVLTGYTLLKKEIDKLNKKS